MAKPNKPTETENLHSEPSLGTATTPVSENGKTEKPKKLKRQLPSLNLANLFFNNRFVLVFSLICALLMWVVTSVTSTENRSRVIYNVPLDIVVTDEAGNVQVFSQSVKTVNISIQGSNLIINKITENDVRATAVLDNTSTVVEDGQGGMKTYKLKIDAAKNGNELADFEVVDCSETNVTVKVDEPMESTFPVTLNSSYQVGDDYYVNAPTFSTETVTIAGPASVVKQIHTVAADHEFKEELTESQKFTCPLLLLDDSGQAVDSQYLTMSTDTVEVTLTVYARKTLSLKPAFLNMPADFPQDRISVSPETIEVAGAKDTLENLTELTLDSAVNFSEFTISNNSVEVDIILPSGFKNISNVYKATITIDLTGYTQGVFTVSQIYDKNASDNQHVSLLTNTIEVTAIGPKDVISKLTNLSFYCVVDLTNTNNVYGKVELPASVSIYSDTNCWVTGSYTVNLEISETDNGSSSSQSSSSP